MCSATGNIICEAPIEEIVRVFQQTSRADEMYLELRPEKNVIGDFVIPANLLHRHTVLYLTIKCADEINEEKQLMIYSNAFMSSRNTTENLEIDHCNLEHLKFDFMTGFTKLIDLKILNSINVGRAGWTLMPPLPALEQIHFQGWASHDWKEWLANLPNLSKGLEDVTFYNTGFGNEKIDRLLNWLLKTSNKSLNRIEMPGTSMTRIPKQLSSFVSLEILILGCQDSTIDIIAENAFSFFVPISALELVECGIREIKPKFLYGIFIDNIVCTILNNIMIFFTPIAWTQLKRKFFG